MRASDCLGTAVGPLAITHPFNDLLLHFIPHYGLLFFFGGGPHRVACGILVPWTENKLLPLQWKCGALTTGLPENFLIIGSYNLVCPPLLNGQQEVSLAWRWLVWPPTAWEARCSNNIGTCKRRQIKTMIPRINDDFIF